MKNLVIVESPSKIKTIEKYLGKDYKVLSSKGHVRDLATTGKYGLGVDTENNFEPNYKAITGKSKVIKELAKEVKDSDNVYLATDPDREGEAISWHLYDALDVKEENYQRVIFNEITKDVIQEAFKNPRKIDMNLVKSQETRRILDRIIGFRLSKLMQSKTGGKSAGRVQSVALKLIVDREREIQSFIPDEYWEIKAAFPDFEAKLEKYQGKKIEIKGEKEATDIYDKLSKAFNIEKINTKERKKSSVLPFKTSTLQQLASSKHGYGSSKTMRIAQKLYEGIDLGTESTGLITYMRTDSTRLSPIFIDETFKYIKNKYGSEYVGRVKKGKTKDNVQDAHEAIRPTNINHTPESIKKYLSPDEYKIYNMIYARALASLMADAKLNATSIELDNNGYMFKATGSVLTFDGYLKVYSQYEKTEDVILPDFSNYKTNVVIANEILKSQHFTKPKARYTEALLIKEMEKLGIGRPSTYAKTMETLKARNYVNVLEKRFHPTEIGIETTDKLQEYFNNIINVEYTANMEDDLDKIADNKLDNIKVLKEFYTKFEPLVQTAFDKMEKKEAKLTGEKCPECDHDLVIRNGKYGEFTACSNFPKCKYIKKDESKIKEIMDCPKCDGKVVEKKTRRGKVFYGCSKYPKCDFASWDEPIKEKCPECKGTLTINKKDIKKCLNCDYKSE